MLLLGLCGAEKCGRKGARLYIFFVVSRLLVSFGWIPREAASTKAAERVVSERMLYHREIVIIAKIL